MTVRVYTIGHSNHPAEKLLALLLQHAIAVLVDVRSTPYSRWNRQYNREALQKSLAQAGIEYRFAGEYLGGRPKDPGCYRPGPDGSPQIDYPLMMAKDWYQAGIRRLVEIATEQPTAILCSEEDPAHCHRQNLIAQTLLAMGVEVPHIRGSGEVQPAWRLAPAG